MKVTIAELTAKGLTNEQAQAVLDMYGDSVPYARFKQIIDERDAVRGQVSERDGAISELQKKLKSGEDAQGALTAAQEALKQKDEALAKTQKTAAVRLGLAKSKARNEKAVLALLDDSKLELGADGTVKGLDEQLTALQKSDAYLFETASEQGGGTSAGGFNPAGGGTPGDAHIKLVAEAMGLKDDKK